MIRSTPQRREGFQTLPTLTLPTLLVAFTLLIACKAVPTTQVAINGKNYRLPLPPNTTPVGDNLFADVTEISNIDYREYLYWTGLVFGKDSEAYLAALPDTSVWLKDSIYGQIFLEVYHQHPVYDAYPAVGISYEQALDYSAWRSDRVFEMFLVKRNKIPLNTRPNTNNYFSIDRYFAGKIPGIQPDNTLPYPEYRLPASDEWESIARGKNGLDPQFGLDVNNKAVQKAQQNGQAMFATLELTNKARQSDTRRMSADPATRVVTAFYPNTDGIFNAIGNVSEMTSEKGLSKGGSWMHPQADCAISESIPYEIPSCWLGFRNVCSWKFR